MDLMWSSKQVVEGYTIMMPFIKYEKYENTKLGSLRNRYTFNESINTCNKKPHKIYGIIYPEI